MGPLALLMSASEDGQSIQEKQFWWDGLIATKWMSLLIYRDNIKSIDQKSSISFAADKAMLTNDDIILSKPKQSGFLFWTVL